MCLNQILSIWIYNSNARHILYRYNAGNIREMLSETQLHLLLYPETVRQSGYAVLSGPAVDMH